MRVQGGFSTRTQETAELTGTNWERNHRVRVREEKLRRDGQVESHPTTFVRRRSARRRAQAQSTAQETA
jgi:hypothetical protein